MSLKKSLRDLAVGGTRSLFEHFGLAVVRNPKTEHQRITALLSAQTIDRVIDVGANSGQFATKLRAAGFNGKILSIEPLGEAHASLLQKAAGDPHWTVAPRQAAGAQRGSTVINVAGNSVSSSLLSMEPLHQSAAKSSRYVSTESIDVAPLHEIVQSSWLEDRACFLKIDTQGFELEVLRGTFPTLRPVVRGIQVELSLRPLYVGQPSFLEVVRFLGEEGFELVDLFHGFVDPEKGTALQVDGLFWRSDDLR